MKVMSMREMMEKRESMSAKDSKLTERKVTPKKENPATQGQIDAILRLCDMKGYEPDQEKMKTYSSAKEYQNWLYSKYPKNKVKKSWEDDIEDIIVYCEERGYEEPDFDLCGEGNASPGQIKALLRICSDLERAYPRWDLLEGGDNNSASKQIIALGAELRIRENRQTMLLMQSCIDVAGETGTFYTADEIFAMSKEDVEEYVNKYNRTYRAWLRKRPSMEKMKYIEHLCNIMETPFDFDGVYCLDKEQIEDYIGMLESENKVREWSETSLEPELNYETLYPEHKGTDDAEFRKEMRTLINNLYASAGQAVEEEVFETMDFSNLDDIKEICVTQAIWGADVAGMLDRVSDSFLSAKDKEYLLDM